MKITCALEDFDFSNIESDLDVILYGQNNAKNQGCIGKTLRKEILKKKLCATAKAWDLLTIALSVISADSAGRRQKSPDGWTREFELTIAVNDQIFWSTQSDTLKKLLEFLTTDIWNIKFVDGGIYPAPPKKSIYPIESCVSLLSGGLDSLIGMIDLIAQGEQPYAVSQKVTGDSNKQKLFSEKLGKKVSIFQVNHNVRIPQKERPQSQRARSFIFIAYGVFIATSLAKYKEGETVPLYVCENGYISINPSLTTNRIGSLSTRTTHPVTLGLLQEIIDAAKINVKITNPYQLKTKGEMMVFCKNQALLEKFAAESTSCGRPLVNKHQGRYVHCGRCVPCIIRRAAFYKWNKKLDSTVYSKDDLSINDIDHAGFDDVRAMKIAINDKNELGIQRWLGASLSSSIISDKDKISDMIERGLNEVEAFLNHLSVK